MSVPGGTIEVLVDPHARVPLLERLEELAAEAPGEFTVSLLIGKRRLTLGQRAEPTEKLVRHLGLMGNVLVTRELL